MAKKQLLDDIKAEPTRIFRAPSDVMRDRRFSDNERLEILVAWENIARAEGEDTRLNAIIAARSEVESKLSAARVNGTAVP